MNLDRMSSLVSRLFFLAAFVLLALAALERLTIAFGYTILRGAFAPGRLLDFAVVLLLFAMALLLRQIREGLERRRGA